LSYAYRGAFNESDGLGERQRLKNKSIQTMRKAVDMVPTFAPYWMDLGKLQYQLGEKVKGVQSLETASRLAPYIKEVNVTLLTYYLKYAQESENTEMKAQFLEKAKALYNKLKEREMLPTYKESRRWMGDENYALYQRLVPLWNMDISASSKLTRNALKL